MNTLDVLKLKKEYGKQSVLKDVSFSVRKGSIVSCLGVNGAGKTTVISIIATLLAPTSGKVSVDGYREKRQIQKRMGIVFQENTLDEELSVYDNLWYRGKLYGIKGKELNRRILELSVKLHFDSYLDKKVKYCSGGQKRLIQITRAIVHHPVLLILDEPTVGLDPKMRRQVWELLQYLKKENEMSILFTSHYLEEANYSDTVCILHQGYVLCCLSREQLKRKYGCRTLKVNGITKEVNDVKEALSILFHTPKIDSFSYQEHSMEDIFLHLLARRKRYVEFNS